MFFNLEILCRQGKGRFLIPWIAATRGVRGLSKTEIESVNVVQLCDKLQELIVSESNKPKQRISLSLSAKLMHGLTLIHNKQILMLLDDTINFVHDIESPFVEKAVQRKSKVRVVKKKDKSKKSKILLPVEMFSEDQHVFTVEEISAALNEVPKATVDSLTLRDELRITVPRDETEFDDLGGLEAELHVQKSGHVLSKPSLLSPTMVEETLQAQHPTELELHNGEPVPKRPRRHLMEPSPITVSVGITAVTAGDAELPSTSLVVQPVYAESTPVIPRKNRILSEKLTAPKMSAKYFIHEEPVIRKMIDHTCEINDEEPTFTLISDHLINLRDDEPFLLKRDIDIGGPDSERISLRLSLMRSMREKFSTPTSKNQRITSSITRDVHTSTGTQPSANVIHETSQENFAQKVQSAAASKLGDTSIPLIEAETTHQPDRASLSSANSMQHRKFAKERQLAIVQVIQKWNFEEGELTIAHLCDSSRTWRKLALTFEDILFLSKYKYVKLICYSNSIELRCIEKASRLE